MEGRRCLHEDARFIPSVVLKTSFMASWCQNRHLAVPAVFLRETLTCCVTVKSDPRSMGDSCLPDVSS